jgi:hypothetical protein
MLQISQGAQGFTRHRRKLNQMKPDFLFHDIP